MSFRNSLSVGWLVGQFVLSVFERFIVCFKTYSFIKRADPGFGPGVYIYIYIAIVIHYTISSYFLGNRLFYFMGMHNRMNRNTCLDDAHQVCPNPKCVYFMVFAD